jgi:hypothetical protein
MIVLDAQGVSGLVSRDPRIMALVKGLADRSETVVASAATLVEAVDPAAPEGAVSYALSRLTTLPVSKMHALAAIGLLRQARRHGHQHALDALVCATALLAETDDGRATTIVTSDPKDILTLVQDHEDISVLAV